MQWKIISFLLTVKFLAVFSNLSSLASAEDIFWNICNMNLILGRGFYGLTTAFFRKTSNPNEE